MNRLFWPSRLAITIPMAVAGCTVCGCASRPAPYFESHPPDPSAVILATSTPSAERPRELRMFAAHTGAPVGWSDLLDAIDWADIVFVGELHDDAIGHAVELAIVEDAFERWPDSALSLEMLERDEQPLVDDYLDDVIDASTLAKLSHSENWGAEGMWDEWYQPMIDVAKQRGGTVVAANAPRRYVRLARTEGYSRLNALPKARRASFDLPADPPPAHYRQRFEQIMHEAAEQAESSPATAPASTSPAMATTAPAEVASTQAGHGGEMTPERLESGFRSQLVWDATMGASIARAARARGSSGKVVHVVGQFHCDFEGGTVYETRRRLPQAKILVISMQQEAATSLRDEDRGRADIVIYTGNPEPAESADSEPASG